MNQKFENEIKIVEKYYHHLYNQDNILHQIRSFKILHGGGFRYESKGKESVSPIKELSMEIFYKYEEVRDFELESFCQKLNEMVINRLGQIQKMMYSEIISATELTGNKVDAKGAKMNPDLILDMLEKIEIRFNEDDEPILPQLHLAPQQFNKIKDMKFTPEQEKRQQEIIDNKRKKWYAKKRYRKLSYLD
ncbi:MAG: hypothetical protein A2315_08530 [Ignavibacteria bacterium RIFOXYB2_FULL_35_12]|nr:MAG: hypothetical protein A2058_04545 [Ignavibacteria bacterium GWA2_36_19]OGU59767.1 MAG: hypothetical protein A2X60_10430 [Ignavibacteria bacterium GWF2_35_20]OGU78762.1 MAG: hypothetical protein A2254_00510 [Ignavibacteria bacterium RIFOXYA2_FULL_35_9]OGU85235.1 MAG: hypothetical protein A3K31_11890 [Ignavibacteria bacterium RIFOXYA12_FULL_35_25]OGU91755.1 MAG: hypothetical protein A2492_07220 [Ignavibacteria bacterium RIFOXYC12_FULL_35_11]OGU97412.1 MAG: hypothetical protein A2347_15150